MVSPASGRGIVFPGPAFSRLFFCEVEGLFPVVFASGMSAGLLSGEVAGWLPCMNWRRASMSEGLCKSTENPCFCKKKVASGKSARNWMVVSHWPLFSISSRLPVWACPLRPEKQEINRVRNMIGAFLKSNDCQLTINHGRFNMADRYSDFTKSCSRAFFLFPVSAGDANRHVPQVPVPDPMLKYPGPTEPLLEGSPGPERYQPV